MSRDRFLLILKYLHFANNRNANNEDHLRKVQPVLEALRRKYRQVFHPFQKLVVDESGAVQRSLCLQTVYPHKMEQIWDKTVFVLCNCESGMILDFIVYTGKTTDIPRNDPLKSIRGCGEDFDGPIPWKRSYTLH